MSQRKQCTDKARVKQSASSLKTDINNDGGGDGLSAGGWHRRSLFSSERLDLILSNLRRHRSKSVDGDQGKRLSHGLSYGRDARHNQQQQKCGVGKRIQYFTARRTDHYDANYSTKRRCCVSVQTINLIRLHLCCVCCTVDCATLQYHNVTKSSAVAEKRCYAKYHVTFKSLFRLKCTKSWSAVAEVDWHLNLARIFVCKDGLLVFSIRV